MDKILLIFALTLALFFPHDSQAQGVCNCYVDACSGCDGGVNSGDYWVCMAGCPDTPIGPGVDEEKSLSK